MARCICDIVCTCNKTMITPSNIGTNDLATVNASSVGACLLGKTRPHVPTTGTDEQFNLFNISNEYRTYAYTLSPKGVGLMAGKSRDKQYDTLKRLHTEVLNAFECSYIITIEIYPGSDNDLHCHGMIRFRSHKKKEDFKKLLKDKLTLYKKGSYPNLIDCEFVNSFDIWKSYINKSQEALLMNSNYYPFIKIDYSFHIPTKYPDIIVVPVANKTFKKQTKDPQANRVKLEMKLLKYKTLVLNLEDQLKNI